MRRRFLAGTPARYDKVGRDQGRAAATRERARARARHVGRRGLLRAARQVDRGSKRQGWQVWSVERRENLLEDQSVLNLAKQGKATPHAAVRLLPRLPRSTRSITAPLQLIPNATVGFAKQWGMSVAVEDLHRVIAAARKLGGKVVLGGHSLGGAVVTALRHLGLPRPPGRRRARRARLHRRRQLRRSAAARRATRRCSALECVAERSPWLTFGGIPAPFAGLFSSTGATAALIDPELAVARPGESALLPAFGLTPPVPVTNLAAVRLRARTWAPRRKSARRPGPPRRRHSPRPATAAMAGTAPAR